MDPQTIAIIVVGSVQGLLAPALFALVRAVIQNGRKIDLCATDQRVDGLAERLAKAEATLTAVDVMSELRAVHERVDDVANNTASVAGELKAAVRSLETLTKHLLAHGQAAS